MRIINRSRHEIFGFTASIAEHNALIARAFFLIGGLTRINTLRDIGRLAMQQHVDLGALPVEAFLLIANVLDGLTSEMGDRVFADLGTAHFTRDHDAVGGGERLTSDADLIGVDASRLAFTEEQVNDKLGEVRIRKETAQAQLFEIKAMQQSGELVPIGEVVDATQKLFSAMHKEIAVRMPKELSARLAKAKTSADVQKIIKTAVDRRFKSLRDDFESYLK